MNWIVQVGTYDLFKSQVHAENQKRNKYIKEQKCNVGKEMPL